MNHEEKQMGLERIVELEKGGVWKRRAARRLRRILETNPQEFWQTYFETVNQPDPELAALMRCGKITTETTFGEARQILDKGGDDAK